MNREDSNPLIPVAFLRGVFVIAGSWLLGSCAAETFFLSPEELARFEAAGPIVPELDADKVFAGLRYSGPYRVVQGDLLEIRVSTAWNQEPGEQRGFLARVTSEGSVNVPQIGTQEVAGKTMGEIEDSIGKALHPAFLKQPPSVVIRVTEFNKNRVTVLGAVQDPGIVELRSDEMSLFGALTAGGGIIRSTNLVTGARWVRIIEPTSDGRRSPDSKPVVLPVKGLNVPMGDVALKGGETIQVERWEPETFTVVGLVIKPGAFQYPPDVRYNLMQALATAGGIDTISDPPYATVFRKAGDGRIVPATFEISGNGPVQASALQIKPGDVIVVEHTAASWTRSLVAQVLNLNVGFFLDSRTINN